MIAYKPLKSVGGVARREVHALLRELSDSAAKKFSAPTLARALRDANTYILTAQDGGAIIGTGTLIVMATATGLRGRIEDVVVASSHRGQGIGREIMRRLIAEARRRRLAQVELTSAPARVAANHLYQALGFSLRETNVYKLVLSAGK
ncbi:MAG: GNAT family N-acetyltransferase [Candidatus Sungbacteria bacterium]|nr:GNAT family N-acetyltransferase [Candidatus Sungbacteria bacterium]